MRRPILTPPPDFQGLRRDVPITCYRRKLPHWRQKGATYFVTFRLRDSLPQSKLDEIEHIRSVWEQKHPPPRTDQQLEQLVRLIGNKVERWLDQGMGECLLRAPEFSAIAVEAIHHFDGKSYLLFAYVIMPNHVHAIMKPLLCETHPLEKCLHSRKRRMSREINKARGKTGGLWQEESFDRIVRDLEHLKNCLKYIGDNPAKAALSEGEYVLWLRPEWRDAGWSFDME